VQGVGHSVLVQYWLENEGLMKDAPMLAEMLALLVAVPETVGAH
jgi:hypothetical protein